MLLHHWIFKNSKSCFSHAAKITNEDNWGVWRSLAKLSIFFCILALFLKKCSRLDHRMWRRGNTARRHRSWHQGVCYAGDERLTRCRHGRARRHDSWCRAPVFHRSYLRSNHATRSGVLSVLKCSKLDNRSLVSISPWSTPSVLPPGSPPRQSTASTPLPSRHPSCPLSLSSVFPIIFMCFWTRHYACMQDSKTHLII
jgi:hypothetical protein